MARDVQGALTAELGAAAAGQIGSAGLLESAAAFRLVSDYNAERQSRQILVARAEREKEKQPSGMSDAAGAMQAAPADTPAPAAQRKDPGERIYLDEVKARLDAALDADVGLVERLVWFWSNHFCVSAAKIRSMAGAYEREAIRPHVLGRFEDMLLAAESHPAMLFYLDNSVSIGPGSVGGINRNRGLNENLAREILELHTLGVRTVYTQQDVTAFAKILTGWTFRSPADDPELGGQFVFNSRVHEPGPITVLGREFPDVGVEQGRTALRMLARHPATARHIASKLARHFVADDPPPALVARLEQAFNDSGGDLKKVTEALVAAPESWTDSRAKLKRPDEWVVGALRAAGVRAEPGRYSAGQAMLGQPIWRPPAPAGFSDMSAEWFDGLGQRFDVAENFAGRISDRADPMAMLEAALGPLASKETRDGLARAESRKQALTLLFMSPEFLRR